MIFQLFFFSTVNLLLQSLLFFLKKKCLNHPIDKYRQDCNFQSIYSSYQLVCAFIATNITLLNYIPLLYLLLSECFHSNSALPN